MSLQEPVQVFRSTLGRSISQELLLDTQVNRPDLVLHHSTTSNILKDTDKDTPTPTPILMPMPIRTHSPSLELVDSLGDLLILRELRVSPRFNQRVNQRVNRRVNLAKLAKHHLPRSRSASSIGKRSSSSSNHKRFRMP